MRANPSWGSPQAMKRSMTWRSTARRIRPEARNSAAWRLAHCHSGLERGERGRYSSPPGALGPGHRTVGTLLPIPRATRESALQCARTGHGLAGRCRVNCPAPGCVRNLPALLEGATPYFDTTDTALVYVFDAPEGKGKVAVRVNYTSKVRAQGKREKTCRVHDPRAHVPGEDDLRPSYRHSHLPLEDAPGAQEKLPGDARKVIRGRMLHGIGRFRQGRGSGATYRGTLIGLVSIHQSTVERLLVVVFGTRSSRFFCFTVLVRPQSRNKMKTRLA